MREYDLIADWYASERVDTAVDGSGVPQVVALAAEIRPSGRVLDIGCGHGLPLTKALLSLGHRVVGVDSASTRCGGFASIVRVPSLSRQTCKAAPSPRRPSKRRLRGE